MIKILVHGLPGSGKTIFSDNLKNALDKYDHLHVCNINADVIRTRYNDWDFSYEGRKRQLERMIHCADSAEAMGFNVVILDFVCPTTEFREKVNAQINIWMDTIKESRYEDTNKIFEIPISYSYRVKDYPESYTTLTKVINRIV